MQEDQPLRDIDLRRLRMFAAVMEAPSMRVAAAELFISQQALSSSIRELERQLKVTLFDRSPRNLTPTPAADILYRGAVPLLAAGKQLISQVRHADDPTPFVIGHSPDLAPSEVFTVIEPVVLDNPSAPIAVRAVHPHDMRAELLSGTIDLALRRGMSPTPDLATTVITHHALRLAVTATHPLATADRVDLEQIADYELVVWGPEHEASYTDILVELCRRAGFEPRVIVSTLIGTPPHTAVIAHPQACALVTNAPGWLYDKRIRIVEFNDPPFTPVRGLWLPGTSSPMRRKILAALE